MILNDIKILTEGAINLDEEWLKNVEAVHKSASTQQKSNKKQSGRQGRQQQQPKNGRKTNQRHNTQK
jgi:hypothetical protein